MGMLRVPIAHAWLVWQRNVYMWQLSCTKLTLQCVYKGTSPIDVQFLLDNALKCAESARSPGPRNRLHHQCSKEKGTWPVHQWRTKQVFCTQNLDTYWWQFAKTKHTDWVKNLSQIFCMHTGQDCSVMEEFCHLYPDPVQPCVLPKSLLRLHDPQMTVLLAAPCGW